MQPSELKNFETWIFDLDNTLYPVSAKLFDQIDKRMCSYIANFLKSSESEAKILQEQVKTLKELVESEQKERGKAYGDVSKDIEKLDKEFPSLNLQ